MNSKKYIFNNKFLYFSYLNFGALFFVVILFYFSFIFIVRAYGYQKAAPGDTITLGEFVFEDDFTPSTEDCTITITDPSDTVVVPGVLMNERADGWHFYNYTIPSNAVNGIWRAVMSCGSSGAGNLVKTDKSFIVDSTMVTKSFLTAELAKGFRVTLSDFGETTVNTAYKAKLQVLNGLTVPTDADSLPTVTIIDPAGTTQVSGATMTKDSAGTYSYSFTIGPSAIGGVWETIVSVVINGQTVRVNDYWQVSSSPADVQILDIPDKVIPFITASVRIDNMGTQGSDFYYVYCIVSSESNLCGGNDDVDFASGTVFINAGGFVNLSLTLDNIMTPGTYWFKVKTRALGETNWAAATQQFIAESGAPPTSPTPPISGGGGGGPAMISTPQPLACSGADFNRDNIVNSVDFSILLFFWRTRPPFANPCVDINKDSQVNSIDFSILLYQWGKRGVNI